MKNILILILFFSINQAISQEKIGIKEIYISNNLAYKVSNDKLFSGIAQKVRNNGHLVYEEKYENGIILISNLYYNTLENVVSDKIIYNPEKPFVISKEIRFGNTTDWDQITYYDENGNKELIEKRENGKYDENGIKTFFEQRENGKLIYSCQYNNNKKHGTEYTLCDNGDELTVKYVNGKKEK